MICESVREAVAVGLLTGTQPNADAAEHLARCPACRAELADLQPIPGLLAAAALEVGSVDQPPPAALLERLLAAAAEERRRRRQRVRLAVGAAVAAAAIILVPTALIVAHRPSTAPTVLAGELQARATNPAEGIVGQVTLSRSEWGSAMTLKVDGVPTGTNCTVVVVTRNGTTQTASTWWKQYPGPATVNGTVAADLASITGVELLETGTGTVLLNVPVRS